jgi:N-methylhydantoinase B/oxoprolinase/acetone carboxylase alpha subunit
MGYYETICGGVSAEISLKILISLFYYMLNLCMNIQAGAGPTWHGCSGVHTHMTNTRITDPEILERRYPVLLRSFLLRGGSGGSGAFRGGDGERIPS